MWCDRIDGHVWEFGQKADCFPENGKGKQYVAGDMNSRRRTAWFADKQEGLSLT